jgi:hypothetical protein
MPASQLVPWIERFATDTRWQMTPAAELDRRHSPMLTADLCKG